MELHPKDKDREKNSSSMSVVSLVINRSSPTCSRRSTVESRVPVLSSEQSSEKHSVFVQGFSFGS